MMTSNLTQAEQNFEQFMPLVQACYPNGQLDKVYARNLVDAYQKIEMSEDVVIALYDNKSASVFFVSDNVQQFHYKRQQLIKWGGLLLFKILHYSHYSFAFNSFRYESKFVKELKELQEANKFYCGGLKMVDGEGNLRKVFIKGKQVKINQTGHTAISVYFIEDITHLIKSNHYWIRMQKGKQTFGFVQQKGKKVFNDLLSDREKEILRLLARNKSSQEIADKLYLSKLTIETHRKNMIKRVGAVNSTAMVHLCKMANLL